MKRKHLTSIFAALILMSLPIPGARAQYSTERFTTHNCTGKWERALGRAADAQSKIVSYHEDENGKFHLTDINNISTSHFSIPDKMKINDIEVFEDEVYFCGNYLGKSVVGHFPLLAFQYGFYSESGSTPIIAPPVPSISFLYFHLPEVVDMTKLEVFRSPVDGKITIVSVGNNPGYPNTTSGIYVITLNGSTITYKEFQLSPLDLFQDVAVTENFIVASGVYKTSSQEYIVMSFIDINLIDSVRSNTYLESAGLMISDYYSIEYLQHDEVAVSSLVLNNSAASHCIPLHVFDFSNLAFSHSQIIPVLQKQDKSNDMLFFSEDSSLLLLHNNLYPDYSGYSAAIYELFPYAINNYTTNTIYNNDSSFNSLARFQSLRFIATGELTNRHHSFFVRDKQATLQSSCFKTGVENALIIALPKKSIDNSFPLYPHTTNIVLDYPVVEDEILDIDCQTR